MKEFKGTKGDWIIRGGYRIDIVTNDDRSFGVVDFGTEQEAFLSDYPLDELKANAQLMAASPDLFFALQMARMSLIEHGFTDKSSTIKSIDKAINKALGL
jgi:hypothetical protein